MLTTNLTRTERDIIKDDLGLSRITVNSDGWVCGIYINPTNPEATGMWLNIDRLSDILFRYFNCFVLFNDQGCLVDHVYAVNKRAAAQKLYAEWDKKGTKIVISS
jgi:hypothetical protein